VTSLKETPQNFPTENPSKGSENHQKGKTGEAQTSLEEPHRVIYTYHERFIQGLTSAPSSYPLTRSHHEALKLVPWKSQGNRKGKIRKQNELRFQEMVAILSPLGLHGGKPKD
jgi:GH43 family beta-xylosidase